MNIWSHKKAGSIIHPAGIVHYSPIITLCKALNGLLEIKRGSTGSHPVDNSFWQWLWTCYETDYATNEWMNGVNEMHRLTWDFLLTSVLPEGTYTSTEMKKASLLTEQMCGIFIWYAPREGTIYKIQSSIIVCEPHRFKCNSSVKFFCWWCRHAYLLCLLSWWFLGNVPSLASVFPWLTCLLQILLLPRVEPAAQNHFA